jgi:SAM-dependent methyltransferase
MNDHVNYDDVASTYDARYTSRAGEWKHTIPAALRQLLRRNLPNRVLEVGCGTGFWLASFHSGDEVYGLDLSPAMLSKAKEMQANVICGTAEQLPFPERTFDLICCVNAFHHFAQKKTFLREAARLLCSGGTLAVIGMDPHGQRDNWYIYDYFQGTYEMDLRRFRPVSQITEWMREAGYSEIRDCVVGRILNHQYGRAVLDHSVLQKNGTSQLILLSDKAYADGLARLKADLEEAEAQGKTLTFPVDISLVMIAAQRK